MGHEKNDRTSLELARRIASELPNRPEWIELAKQNLMRWKSRNAESPGLVRCYDEWLELLEHSLNEVCAELLAESERGQRLRQNSPFAGALTPREVWDIKRRCRDDTLAA